MTHPCRGQGWARVVERVVVGSREPTVPEVRRRSKALSAARHIAAVARCAGWPDAEACAARVADAERAFAAPVLLHGRRAVYVAPSGERYPRDLVDQLVRAA